MAIGADRVQVTKRESTALGGQDSDAVDWPQPINPQQDAIETAGVFIQDENFRDENVYIERHGDDMRFRDQNNTTPVTLSTLVSGSSGGSTFRRHFLLMGG